MRVLGGRIYIQNMSVMTASPLPGRKSQMSEKFDHISSLCYVNSIKGFRLRKSNEMETEQNKNTSSQTWNCSILPGFIAGLGSELQQQDSPINIPADRSRRSEHHQHTTSLLPRRDKHTHCVRTAAAPRTFLIWVFGSTARKTSHGRTTAKQSGRFCLSSVFVCPPRERAVWQELKPRQGPAPGGRAQTTFLLLNPDVCSLLPPHAPAFPLLFCCFYPSSVPLFFVSRSLWRTSFHCIRNWYLQTCSFCQERVSYRRGRCGPPRCIVPFSPLNSAYVVMRNHKNETFAPIMHWYKSWRLLRYPLAASILPSAKNMFFSFLQETLLHVSYTSMIEKS